MAQSDYDTNDLDLLRELAARADTRIAAQLATANSADQRALTFAGFLAAAAALFGNAAAATYTSATGDDGIAALALAAGFVTIVAMVLVVVSARPAIFFFPGALPSDWIDDIATAKPERERLAEMLADYDRRIGLNEAAMKRNGQLVTIAAIILIIGYAVCGLAVGWA